MAGPSPDPFGHVGLEHTNYKFDIDSPPGAQIRYTPDGMAVYMRFDKPGLWYNDHGKRVPDVIAAQAGYDIEDLSRLRKRDEAIARVTAGVEAEFAVAKKRVVAEADDYRVIEVAKGYYNVEFDDGTILNTRGPLGREAAMRRFKELTGSDGSAPADASQPVDADADKGGHKGA